MHAEGGVGISPLLGRLPVLFLKEQEGDALVALEFMMDLIPIRKGPSGRSGTYHFLQRLHQKRLGAQFGQVQGNRLELLEVFGDARRRERLTSRNGLSRQAFIPGQPQNLSGVMHGQLRLTHEHTSLFCFGQNVEPILEDTRSMRGKRRNIQGARKKERVSIMARIAAHHQGERCPS